MADLVERLEVRAKSFHAVDAGNTATLLTDAANRITTLEAEAQENARLLGMGGEREAGLHGEIAQLKRKVAALEAEASEGERRGLERAIALVERGEFDSSVWLDPKRDQNLSDWFRRQQVAAIRALIPEAPVRDGVTIPLDALRWLVGLGPNDEGMWFGDGVAPSKRPFWWRNEFVRLAGIEMNDLVLPPQDNREG